MQKGKGLRRRWLINTAGMICALGLICVVLVTVLFGGYYYSAMESDMRMRVETITGVLESVANQDDDAFYQSCIAYVQTFEKLPHSELQFINTSGVLVASSYGIRTEELLVFDDVMDAIRGQIAQLGYAIYDPGFGPGLKLSPAFFESLKGRSVFEMELPEGTKIEMIHGLADPVVKVEAARAYAEKIGCRINLIPEADHSISTPEGISTLLERTEVFFR